MAILSNDIEMFIKSMLRDGIAELQRNELAERFHCAPSQINYVLATRFTVEKGYVVRSRRGGGGGIQIIRIDVNQKDYLFGVINGLLDADITYLQAKRITEGLFETGIIGVEQLKIIQAALSGKALERSREPEAVRANILRQILVAMLYEE